MSQQQFDFRTHCALAAAGERSMGIDTSLVTVSVAAQYGVSIALRAETAPRALRLNEVRACAVSAVSLHIVAAPAKVRQPHHCAMAVSKQSAHPGTVSRGRPSPEPCTSLECCSASAAA